MRKVFSRLVPALFAALLIPLVALAAPPYDLNLTWNIPATGGPVDGVRVYIDDCAVTGPVGAPAFDTSSPSPWTASNAITADGTYDVCIRGYNAGGEQPDPGLVATVTTAPIPVPAPLDTLSIEVVCRDSGGAIVACASTGVDVTVTIN